MYDKKTLTILRAVLIVIGAATGGTAVWQYFVYYPDVMRREFSIVVIVVSAVVLGAVFGLAAKSVYRLAEAIKGQFGNLKAELGYKGVIAAVCGFVAAVLVGLLFDFIISRAVEIIAVRVLSDAIIVALFAALCCYAFIRWIASDDTEPVETSDKKVGYLLTASCFEDDRVYAAAEFLCCVKVTSATFKALWKFADGAALDRLKTVTESGAADVIRLAADFDTAEQYIKGEAEIAAAKRLKPIAAKSEKFGAVEGGAALEVFAADDGAKNRLALIVEKNKAAAAIENADKSETKNDGDKGGGDSLNGEIIIDK